MAILAVLWVQALRMPFAGDDFIFLAVMQPGGPGPGAVVDWRLGFFRPLSQGALLCGMAALLPPSPVLYHSLILALYLATAGLYFSLVRRLSGSAGLAALAALLWGSRSAHFLAVAWFSAAQEILMVLFALGALRLAAAGGNQRDGDLTSPPVPLSSSPSILRIILVAALSLAALLSKETAIVMPALLAAFLVAAGYSPRRTALHPYVLVTAAMAALWLILRLATSTLIDHASGTSGGWNGLMRNIAAYPLMFFDVNREVIRHLATGGGWSGQPLLFVWVIAVAALVVAIGFLIFAFCRTGQTSQTGQTSSTEIQDKRLWAAAILWGAAAMLPLLFNTQSFYGYYMLLANGGWCLFAALMLHALIHKAGWGSGVTRKTPTLTAVVIAAILALSATSIALQITLPGSHHQRAIAVEAGLTRLKAAQPAPLPGAIIHIVDLDAASDEDARLWRAIGWGAALPFLWSDGSLRVHSAFQPLDDWPSQAASPPIAISIKDYIRF